MDTTFTPSGLSNIRVRRVGSFFYVDLLPGAVRTFHYNPATDRHDIPVVVEGPHHYAIDRRNTARGACAAAYAHDRFIKASLAAGHSIHAR